MNIFVIIVNNIVRHHMRKSMVCRKAPFFGETIIELIFTLLMISPAVLGRQNGNIVHG